METRSFVLKKPIVLSFARNDNGSRTDKAKAVKTSFFPSEPSWAEVTSCRCV